MALSSEGRLAILINDVEVLGANEEGGLSLNGEILFPSPEIFAYVLSPRPHLGVTFNTEGFTSFIYGGLTWHWTLGSSFFIEGSFGGAVHNGELREIRSDRKALGCRALFRESVAFGIRIHERQSLMISLEHLSNGGLCDDNEGLNLAGLRYGLRF